LMHSEILYGSVLSEAACAAKCNECVDGQISGGLFRGFFLHNTSCSCLVDVGGALAGAGTGTCTAKGETGGSGTGPITQTLYSGIVCYKIKQE